MANELLVFNGLNAATGEYDLPPMPIDELAQVIEEEKPPENLNELRYRNTMRAQQHLGVPVGLAPERLDQTGWGVIMARDADLEPLDALGELLALREQQAQNSFRLFVGEGGYQPGDTKRTFLERASAAAEPDTARKAAYNLLPEAVPYHLLIVGSPQEIPFEFQAQLDVGYSVGRLHFDTLDEYANYARNVVAVEKRAVDQRQSVALFAPVHEGDQWTNLTTHFLVQPLLKRLSMRSRWSMDDVGPDMAHKGTLRAMLSGPRKAALVCAVTHGLTVPGDDARQRRVQGAIVCQDWPGIGQGALTGQHFFAADDLSDDADLRGQIIMFYSSNSAGTPAQDVLARRGIGPDSRFAAAPFTSALAQRLLGHPKGALAVIGQVQRTWGYAFPWSGAGAQTTVFEGAMARLLDGDPVGLAVEHFDERYTELTTDLSDLMEAARMGTPVDHRELSGMWTASNDAESFVVLGDPSVRLPAALTGTR